MAASSTQLKSIKPNDYVVISPTTVNIEKHLDIGYRIATISVDGNPTDIYAPNGSGGSTVNISDTLSAAIPAENQLSIAKFTIDGATPIGIVMRNDYVTSAQMPLTFDRDEEAETISVTNDAVVVFAKRAVEVPSLLVDPDEGAQVQFGSCPTSANIFVDGNYYAFGDGLYGNMFAPNSAIVSSDITKTFKDDDETLSVDIIADRRWTSAYVNQRMNVFAGKTVHLTELTLEDALSALYEALGAKVEE